MVWSNSLLEKPCPRILWYAPLCDFTDINQLIATGAKARGELIRTLSPALYNPKTHSIRVNSKLQVDDKSYPHIFVAGDVADTPDLKMAYKAGMHAPVVAKNIISLIKNQTPTAEYTPTTHEMVTLPMGKLGGVSYLAFFGGMHLVTTLLI